MRHRNIALSLSQCTGDGNSAILWVNVDITGFENKRCFFDKTRCWEDIKWNTLMKEDGVKKVRH